MSDPQGFLIETAQIVQQRANRYEADYYGTAALWSSMLGIELNALDVLRMMICLKLVRTMHDPSHEDSWRDIAGYAALGPQVFGEITEASDDDEEQYDDEYDEQQAEVLKSMLEDGVTVSTTSSAPPEDAEDMPPRPRKRLRKATQ